MWMAKRVPVGALTAALGVYALDGVGMTTPQQAMQCCNSMRCPRSTTVVSVDCCIVGAKEAHHMQHSR